MKAEGIKEHHTQREGLRSWSNWRRQKTSASSRHGNRPSHFTHLEDQKTIHKTSFQALDNRQHRRGPSEKGHKQGAQRQPPPTTQRDSGVPEQKCKGANILGVCKGGSSTRRQSGPRKLPASTDQCTHEKTRQRLGRNHKKGANRSFPALTCMGQPSVPTCDTQHCCSSG